MSSNQSGEDDIRKAIIEADLVDCMVALPGKLFYSTPIPVCLWFLARNKNDGKRRDRRKQTLFIDARKLGQESDRTHIEFTDEDIQIIASTYHAWYGDDAAEHYKDKLGFCKSATNEVMAEHGYSLSPGRYVGAEASLDDDTDFVEIMAKLSKDLRQQISTGSKLNDRLEKYLESLES
jgi:type I restriction enzyme M protein